MATKSKAAPATATPSIPNDRLVAIYRSSVGPVARRNPDDAELCTATAALAALIGKEAAASLPWQRRLAVTVDGKTPLLLVDGHTKPIGQWPGMVHPFPLALPLEAGVELLRSAQNPEPAKAAAEKIERQRHAEEAERNRKAREAADAEISAQRKLETEQATCHADEWAALDGLQRFAVRMVLALEKHGLDELASDIRALLAEEIASVAIDSSKDFPRDPSWFTGLGLDGLSPERKRALQLAAQAERDEAVIASIPSDKLSALRAMYGNDRAAIANRWRLLTLTKARSAGPEDSDGLVRSSDIPFMR